MRRERDEEEDSRFEDDYLSIVNDQCLTCYSGNGAKTALLLFETAQWNFYYCYRCRGWYQKHYRIKHLVLPIKDKMMLKSLNWFYASESQIMGVTEDVTAPLRRLFSRIKELFYF